MRERAAPSQLRSCSLISTGRINEFIFTLRRSEASVLGKRRMKM